MKREPSRRNQRLRSRLTLLLAMATVWAAGCGEGTSRRVLHLLIRVHDIPADVLATVNQMAMTVEGDTAGPTDAGARTLKYPVLPGELDDGELRIDYGPQKKSGDVYFHVSLLEPGGTVVAFGDATASVGAVELTIDVSIEGGVGVPDGGDGEPDGGADVGATDGADGTGSDVGPGNDGGGGTDAGAPDTGTDAAPDADMCATATCGGTTSDGCCPLGCTALTDTDCAGCGNGRIEAGETCDPPGSCPVCDDQNDCTDDVATGSAATCNVVCKNTPKVCSLAGKDRCCPAGCGANTDSDCAGCGDGVVDPDSGETCDPMTSCPAAASCTPAACWEVKTFTGSADTCNAKCSTTMKVCSGTKADGCCPPGCNTSAANRDVDCPAMCGNGVTETGETCDPLTSCPTACPQMGCQLRTLQGAGTCAAACVATGQQTACVNGDGCCPATCNANNDNDCAPKCGNGVIEKGEVCDGNCPTACPQMGCQLRTLQGSAATCNAQCVNGAPQTMCAAGDACCPTGCNANNDADCGVKCGNGIVETGETCDGNCPTACPQMGCQLRTLQGSAAMCNAQCVNGAPQTACVNNDGCCPTTCNANNDNDCKPVCGNGVIESGELCDPLTSCPSSCPQLGCQLRTLQAGGTCAAQCVNAGTAGCSMGTSDGCCGKDATGAMCTHLNDIDCPVPNDKCEGAIDISKGGQFSVDLLPQIGAETTAPDGCAGGKNPEVFFWFELTSTEWVYLDVHDGTAPATTPVALAVELWEGGCPGTGGKFGGKCVDGSAGTKRCPGLAGAASLAIPVMDSGAGGILQRPLPAGKYWVVVRSAGEKPGRWPLRFDHVPITCVPTGNELVPTAQVQALGPTTCQQGDDFNPSCAARPVSDLDVSYVVMKCPNLAATFTTCASKTVADTVLSAIQGSVAYDADKRCAPTGDAKEVACDAGDPNSKVCPRPGSASIAVENVVSGILTVNVDNQPIVGAAACGAFELDYCAGKACLPLSR